MNLGGWGVFYVLILFYVRWNILEQACFRHEDPENWEHPLVGGASSSDRRYHLPAMGLAAMATEGRAS